MRSGTPVTGVPFSNSQRLCFSYLPAHSGVHGRFAGEAVSDLKQRPEGVRIKHRVNRNSLKMHDKFGTVLRVETTLNDPSGWKVLHEKQGDPDGAKSWLPLRKRVADLSRRAQLSQSANARYLEGLGQVDAEMPLSKLTDKLCRPVTVEVEGRDQCELRSVCHNPLPDQPSVGARR